MKKSLYVLALLSAFAAAGYAQSGRKIEPVAVPAPVPVEETPAYSESTPQPKRPLQPRRRNRAAKRSAPVNVQNTSPTMPGSEAGMGSDEVERVETNLVTIPVSVFDRNGLYVANLQQKDFKIFEDGEEQEIAYFGVSEKPFTVVLLLDTSPSTVYKIEEIQGAARAFVDQLKPQDSVMVIEFDGNVHVLTEATQDRDRIYKAIKRADFGGGTSLYDAVDFSLRKRLDQVSGRKAIVLFTDGVDTTSTKSDYEGTLSFAEEADALIFPIYYNTFFENRQSLPPLGSIRILQPRGTLPEDYALGREYLKDLASYTGGRVFRPETTPGGLTAAFEGIAEELRRQYNIGYIPTKDGETGQRKLIKVRVDRPNLVIRSRDSYIVGSNKSQ